MEQSAQECQEIPMNVRIQLSMPAVVAAVLLSAMNANGQGRGGGRMEGFDPASILKRADDNNNGIIEPSEVSNRSRMFIERAAQRAQLEMGKPMPIAKLLPAMQANFDEYKKQQEAGAKTGGGSTPPASSSTPKPATSFVAPAVAAPAATSSSGFGGTSSRAGSIINLEAKFEQSVIDYVNNDLLRKLDKNGDGNLDSGEWKAHTWSKPPEDSDLNKDGKLSREELCIRISKSRGIPIKGETASTTGGSSSTSGSSGGSPADKFKKYAEQLLKDYDKSKDGMLQRDEWKEMKTEHQGADSDGDGVITLAELTNRVSAYSSGGASTTPLSSSGGSSYGGKKGSGDKTASGPKKSYRFLTPTERLPKGMPDWFIKNDADGDGQIMMAEYSTSWTDATAAEFAKLDRDGDGIITPRECVAAENGVEKKK
jgi:Ca2+-binding EF-hand superfamily protein